MNKILFGAAVLGGIGCAAIGVPVDFVLFGVTLSAVEEPEGGAQVPPLPEERDEVVLFVESGRTRQEL